MTAKPYPLLGIAVSRLHRAFSTTLSSCLSPSSSNMLTTSISLLDRLCLRIDEASWSEFVDLYAPVLCRWTLAAGVQLADAQEITQEVLVFVHQRLDRFRHQGKGAFRAWLKQATLNKIRELRRRRRVEASHIESWEHLDALADPKAAAAWDVMYAEGIFQRACELVRPLVEERTWQIFERVYLDRRPAAAVALEFHVSRNMVYVAQCRCLAKVRRIVDRYLDDIP